MIFKNTIKYNLLLIAFILFSNPLLSQENDKKTDKNENEQITLDVLDQVPYPNSCEIYKNNQEVLRKCLSKYISKHVVENFRTRKFYNYPSKSYKIHTQFKIDKEGKITDIKARGPHKKMEKEAIRVIKKLPRLNPGEHDGVKVAVLYGLPIKFVVPKKPKK